MVSEILKFETKPQILSNEKCSKRKSKYILEIIIIIWSPKSIAC